MKYKSILLALAFSLVALPGQALSEEAQATSGIVMHADGLPSNLGSVYCAIYASEKGFPTEPKHAIEQVKVEPRDRKATCVFRDVKAGRYAVALWHDVNNNKKVDTNWLGIPTEPLGASNNATGSFGPPKFSSAAFEYRSSLFQQTIRLK